jgi:hypothetical protein
VNIFDDGEVLGAVVTALAIVGPILAQVAWDKWKGRNTPPTKDQGEG